VSQSVSECLRGVSDVYGWYIVVKNDCMMVCIGYQMGPIVGGGVVKCLWVFHSVLLGVYMRLRALLIL